MKGDNKIAREAERLIKRVMARAVRELQDHVSQCGQYSGPDDGCEIGQRLEQNKIDNERLDNEEMQDHLEATSERECDRVEQC